MTTNQITYDYDPRSIPSEYLEALGLIATAAAQTEDILQQFIGGLLGIDMIQSIALTTHLSFPLKDNIIRTLAEIDAPDIDELDKIDSLLDRAKNAIDKRNIALHNSLAINPLTNDVFSHRQTARGKLAVSLQKISAQEIKEDAVEIYQVGMEIYQFMISRGLQPKNRNKPLSPSVKRGPKARKERGNP
ncbi:MAG: hypothetical protein HRT94_07400 [Alphaproteobacteria bacterium]|nr:hypothetical protein [Alphaproteobacteria bacterium]